MGDLAALVERTEQRRQRVNALLQPAARARLGQFFTPAQAAELIANLPRLPRSGHIKILDPGAGVGSLTAALTARIVREAPGVSFEVFAVEIDDMLGKHLQETLDDCVDVASSHGLRASATLLHRDFPTSITGFGSVSSAPLANDSANDFDLAIMNPPYGKLPASSGLRRGLAAAGVECPNLYSAFLAVAAMLLRDGGQLVAITPRSFANGPYFAGFRRYFLDRIALDHVHLFESRSTVFSDAKVLQENVVISGTRGGNAERVTLTSSTGHDDEISGRSVPYHQVVRPTDRDRVVHLEVSDEDASATAQMSALPCSLEDLGLRVSTGRVVDFRVREHLRESPGSSTAPLIYPGNLRDGGVSWPLAIRKPQAIADTPTTRKLFLPAERFVLVKRFSSKEEKRRVVAAVYEPGEGATSPVAFENHLNYFHVNGRGLSADFATGLCLWLNSSFVDRNFRTFSGHTQVNATDLRSMRYPAAERLRELGSSLGQSHWPDVE